MNVPRWAARGGVAILCAALAFVYLRGLDRRFGNGEEVIHAQSLREMARSGDPSRLTWQGEEALKRPSTPFAFYALMARMGEGERGLRLGPTLASLVILALVFVITWLVWHRRDAAALAALLCAGAPSFYLHGRSLSSDPPFVAALMVALLGALWAIEDRRGLLVAGAGLGGAFAMKSLAALFPAAALLPWLVMAARRHRSWSAVLGGLGLFAAASAPFYVVGLVRHGGRFLSEHAGYGLLARSDLAAEGGPLAYARHMVEGDGVIVTAWLALAAVAGAVVGFRRRDARLGIPAATALVMFAGLSLVGTRLPYLLPIYPLAAVCAAGLWVLAAERWRGPLWRSLAVAAAAVLFLHGIARPSMGVFPRGSSAAVALGIVAAETAEPGEPVFALEWYAPAFGYYADRPMVMVAASSSFFRTVDDIDVFHAAGAIAMAPPSLPTGRRRWLIAGPVAALEQAGWVGSRRRLAQWGGVVLIEAGPAVQ